MFPTIRMVGPSFVLALAFGAPGEAAAKDAPSRASQKPRAQVQHVSAAHAALAAGDPRRALALLGSRTLRLSPVECYSVEGRAYFLLGDYALARRKLEMALRMRSKHASDLYWLGRTYVACGMPALAAARFEEARWNGLDTADLHYHWAVTLKSLGELLGKISQRQWPEDAQGSAESGSFALGGLVVGPVPTRPDWVIVSPPNSALYQVHRALEMEPERGDALLLCGELWAAVDQHKQAALLFAKAARQLTKEDLARCHKHWAASLLALGDFDGYLMQAREHMCLTGGIDSAEMARCYDRAAREVAQRGNLKREIQYLTLSVELKPKVDRLITLADALLEAQRGDDAGRYLRMALEQRPSPSQRRRILLRLQRTTYLTSPH